MLTDAEVADAARQALADELAGLTPSADLLARVRARHSRTLRMRRAASAGLATVTAGGLAAAIVAGTGATSAALPRPIASRTAVAKARPRAQTIVLDGLTIKVAPPFHLTLGPASHIALDSRPATEGKFLLFSGKIPAGARRIAFGARTAYLLETASGPSLYVPTQGLAQVHYLVLSFGHVASTELIELADSITIAGKPGFLRSAQPSPNPATHCPCG
jgi:hypothetical protein